MVREGGREGCGGDDEGEKEEGRSQKRGELKGPILTAWKKEAGIKYTTPTSFAAGDLV